MSSARLIISHAEMLVILISDLERAWRGEQTITAAPTLPDKRSEQRSSRRAGPIRAGKPRVIILHATGSNRDRDAAAACTLAGGEPEIVHMNQLLAGERRLLDYHMLVLPGGFSYGDDLGAGKL